MLKIIFNSSPVQKKSKSKRIGLRTLECVRTNRQTIQYIPDKSAQCLPNPVQLQPVLDWKFRFPTRPKFLHGFYTPSCCQLSDQKYQFLVATIIASSVVVVEILWRLKDSCRWQERILSEQLSAFEAVEFSHFFNLIIEMSSNLNISWIWSADIVLYTRGWSSCYQISKASDNRSFSLLQYCSECFNLKVIDRSGELDRVLFL
jgi:hypothetical protein